MRRLEVRAAHRAKVERDIAGAIADAKAAVELSPADYDGAQDLLADLYFRSGKMAEALPLYEGLLTLRPEDIDLLERVESLLVKKGKLEDAEKIALRIEAMDRLFRRP